MKDIKLLWENYTDGRVPTAQQIVFRSLSRIIPFAAFSFLGTDGWHDSLSDTRVINTQDYESEKQVKEEINSIGIKEFTRKLCFER